MKSDIKSKSKSKCKAVWIVGTILLTGMVVIIMIKCCCKGKKEAADKEVNDNAI